MKDLDLAEWMELAWIQDILLAVAVLVVGWIASKIAHRVVLGIFRKQSLDEAAARFLATMVRHLMLAGAVIASLNQAGIEATSFVALLGAAGLTVGFALQGALGNLASGVTILLFRPFSLGDRVTAGGHTGKVDDIGLLATTMISSDNETIIIPNTGITSGSIINHTKRGTLRGSIEIGIAYGTDVAQALEIMNKAVRGAELVLPHPEPSVTFAGFGASALDFVVRGWADTSKRSAMLQNVRVALYNDLNAAGIDIPFDQIVVHQAGPSS